MRDALDLTRAQWRKSSRSGNGANCVEVAAVWRKSSRSGGNGDCVEVAAVDRTVAVRDSKDPDGPKLAFDGTEWDAFVRRIRAGTYDPTG